MRVEDYSGDYEYANSRLSNSLVLVGNVPMYIDSVREDGSTRLYDIPFNEADPSYCDLSDVDLSPIPLGYCNYKYSATYLSRMPSRYYKQGICQNNIVGTPDNVYFGCVEMKDTIMNVYPKPLQVMEKVICREWDSMAFSRNFALKNCGFEDYRSSLLIFRGDVVGNVHWNGYSDTINFNLRGVSSYLQELLEEETNV